MMNDFEVHNTYDLKYVNIFHQFNVIHEFYDRSSMSMGHVWFFW
jgi:hypothetical protein